MSANPISGLWPWTLLASALALLAGACLLEGMQLIGIAIGCLTGLALTFMLARMGSQAVARGGFGKSLIFSVFLKSFVRFLLTGLFLAILFYLGWLKPLGFIIGFTVVVGTIFVWGCSRLFIKSN